MPLYALTNDCLKPIATRPFAKLRVGKLANLKWVLKAQCEVLYAGISVDGELGDLGRSLAIATTTVEQHLY